MLADAGGFLETDRDVLHGPSSRRTGRASGPGRAHVHEVDFAKNDYVLVAVEDGLVGRVRRQAFRVAYVPWEGPFVVVQPAVDQVAVVRVSGSMCSACASLKGPSSRSRRRCSSLWTSPRLGRLW